MPSAKSAKAGEITEEATRTKMIKLRVTEEEQRQIRMAAASHNQTMGKFAFDATMAAAH